MSLRVGTGSRSRLRAYILANIGRILDSSELRRASGNASEWARRLRELRTEEGYQILTHNDRSDLRPGQYLLLDAKPFQLSHVEFPKRFARLFWTGTGSRARCAVRLQGNLIHLIQAGRRDFRSGTLLINPWAGEMIQPT